MDQSRWPVPPWAPGADLGNAVGQEGVVSEVWDAEEPFCRRDQVAGEDVELDPVPQHDGGEEGRGVNQGHHVAQPVVGHHPDILKVVALLGEADSFLDAPAREIAETTHDKTLRFLRIGKSVSSIIGCWPRPRTTTSQWGTSRCSGSRPGRSPIRRDPCKPPRQGR